MLRSFKGNEFSYLFNYAMEVSITWSFCILARNNFNMLKVKAQAIVHQINFIPLKLSLKMTTRIYLNGSD